MTPQSPPPFADTPAIRCERAIAELRSGRPVVLSRADGTRRAVLAVDGSGPAAQVAFAAAAGDVALVLSTRRAAALGIDVPNGIRVPCTDGGLAARVPLAFERGLAAPAAWVPADADDAAGLALARLALLLPALFTTDVAADAHAFDGCVTLALDDLAAAPADAARTLQEVARAPVPLRDVGVATFVVFRGGLAQRDQVAVVVGTPDPAQPVPVRVHSACLTGDLFGSLKCDCGDQLRLGLAKLSELGGGVLLYLDQEGRGIGIASKMRAYGYQHAGLDTIDADAELGYEADERSYELAAAMLRLLDIPRVQLLSNNPEKQARLRAAGVDVVARLPVTGQVTRENEGYLRTKALRAGHALDVDALLNSGG